MVTDLQHSPQFHLMARIGPCVHTIDLKDLSVSPWGLGRGGTVVNPKSARPFHRGMRRPRFIEVKPCHSTKKNFSKNRSKNAASWRAKQSVRRTEHFGGKLLGVGKNNFAKRNDLNALLSLLHRRPRQCSHSLRAAEWRPSFFVRVCAKDCSEHRQAAGVIAPLTREAEEDWGR
jgi:hypothetical protein